MKRKFMFSLLMAFNIFLVNPPAKAGALSDFCSKLLARKAPPQHDPYLESAMNSSESLVRSRVAQDLKLEVNDGRIEWEMTSVEKTVDEYPPYIPIVVRYRVKGFGTFLYKARWSILYRPYRILSVEPAVSNRREFFSSWFESRTPAPGERRKFWDSWF
jgi:hypothetical protein